MDIPVPPKSSISSRACSSAERGSAEGPGLKLITLFMAAEPTVSSVGPQAADRQAATQGSRRELLRPLACFPFRHAKSNGRGHAVAPGVFIGTQDILPQCLVAARRNLV